MKTVPIIMYLNGCSVIQLPPGATFTFYQGGSDVPEIKATIHSVVCKGTELDMAKLDHVAAVGTIEIPDDGPDVVRVHCPHDTLPFFQRTADGKGVEPCTPNLIERPGVTQ